MATDSVGHELPGTNAQNAYASAESPKLSMTPTDSEIAAHLNDDKINFRSSAAPSMSYPSPPSSLHEDGSSEDDNLHALPRELAIDPERLLELASTVQTVPQETGFSSIIGGFLLDMTIELSYLFWFFLSEVLYPRLLQLLKGIARLLVIIGIFLVSPFLGVRKANGTPDETTEMDSGTTNIAAGRTKEHID